MVLRNINRQMSEMAACDQPLKKKQRIDGPDIDEGSDNSGDGLADVFVSTTSIPEELAARAGESPDSGTVSEDAVDCASVLRQMRNSQQCDKTNANIPQLDSLKSVCEWNGKDDTLLSDLEIIQDALVRQCLCGVDETILRRPFNGRVKLTNWPLQRTLTFLSSLQLTLDVYLRQNQNGAICARLSDVCDALVRNEYDWIKEVTDLSDHKSKFVNFVASRVLSSFMIVAKDSLDQSWLQQIVDNVYLFNTFDVITVRKINFSLDVIRRIVEWKDMEQHPLEETTHAPYTDGPNPFGNPSSSQTRPSTGNSQLYTNETRSQAGEALQNAFSNLHTNSSAISVNGDDNVTPSQSTFRLHEPVLRLGDRENEESLEEETQTDDEETPTTNGRVERFNDKGCLTVILTDSESFDTAYIKCLMIKTLEHHWLDLVKNVRLLLTRYINISNAENCILNFLSLWENIISVKANLSVIDTKPFYTDLESFVDLLRCTTLPSLIYTQLLGLFNEVLCYGSTLALQDLLPEETCMLAHCVVRFVKDYRLLNDVRIRNSRSGFGFVGFDSPLVGYSTGDDRGDNSNRSLISTNHFTEANSDVALHMRAIRHEVDKTMLQKMALLVLKSVAVTVKEMRCDSSDSSIDSSDYNAIQDMQIVERSIRDVLKRLDAFIKNALEFHPETSFTKILIHLFSEQDDYLIESMVCTLDITVGIVYRNSVYPDLILMLNPVLTFVEFLKVVSHDSDVLLDYLVSNETCFLLYLLRFLKYVRRNWSKFIESCQESEGGNSSRGLDDTMSVLIRLRLQISRLVSKSLFPYNISPVLRLLEVCESLYEGNELS